MKKIKYNFLKEAGLPQSKIKKISKYLNEGMSIKESMILAGYKQAAPFIAKVEFYALREEK